ncbi:MAG TPA: hypothetical protein VG742_19155 [Dongiaceae bacterium]|nr:hypothetical protein [Dongiaceae bacterium]
MRRSISLLCLILAACATPDDPYAAFMHNTVLVTQPWGEVDHLQLSADHAYVMYGVRFPEGHGAWSIEDGKVCLMPGDTPETRGQRFCNAWAGRRVGDRWNIEVAGQTVPMALAAGRLGPVRTPASPP